MDLYGLKKRGQCCRPSSPTLRAKRELMSLFWKLEREIGLQEALECFQKAVDLGREELEHDVMVLSRWCILYYHMDYSNLT